MNIEENEIEDNEYDREKTLAVLTGLICMCVSAGGTVLGSYHAINTIGAFAGLLATACYIIADLVVYWAARIDYKEDGNAMEWCSWGVKYALSFYLVFCGGCVALHFSTMVESKRIETLLQNAQRMLFSNVLRVAQNKVFARNNMIL